MAAPELTHLIIGADSSIGKAAHAQAARLGLRVIGTSRRAGSPHVHLDMTAGPATWAALPKADTAAIFAAQALLADCERDPQGTRKVNVEGTLALAQALHAQGTFVIFISTNQVFNGEKPYRLANDATCPLNEYGRQKAQAEQGVLTLGNSAVLRLTKVIVPGDLRIAAWYQALREGKAVTAFDDIFLSPVTLPNVIEAWMRIAERRAPGIYQISGATDFSYYDLARAIARYAGKDDALVKRGSGAKAGVPASFRPRYSSYEDTGLIRASDIDGIVEYALGGME